MTRRPNELDALQRSRVGLFMLGDGSGADHAKLLVSTLPIVRRAARNLHPAFVARIDRSGELIVTFRDGERLPTPVRIKPNRDEWPRAGGGR